MTTQGVNDISTFIDKISSALGISANSKYINELNSELSTMTNGKNIKIMNDPNINSLIDSLLKADNNLKEFYNKYSEIHSEDFSNSWFKMNEQFAKMQALSLLEKTINCDEIINDLMSRLHNKLDAVNKVIEANLNKPIVSTDQRGGNKYYEKYIKYKEKYLHLKIYWQKKLKKYNNYHK